MCARSDLWEFTVGDHRSPPGHWFYKDGTQSCRHEKFHVNPFIIPDTSLAANVKKT